MTEQTTDEKGSNHAAATDASAATAKSHTVQIHINRQAYNSPTPTTGEALYKLGDIGKHQELFREVDGDHEDELVPRDAATVRLKQDEHFYSQKVINIFVNSDEHEVNEKHISYARIIELYLGGGGQPSNEYLVKYSQGPKENPKGTLAPGQTVKVKDDMRFRVAGTGES